MRTRDAEFQYRIETRAAIISHDLVQGMEPMLDAATAAAGTSPPTERLLRR
jgi:hypothetical protein